MVWEIQSNFSAGVLDPKLKGRIDKQIYYDGLETANNVIVLPQGGVTRRPGFEYLATLADNARLFAFEFNTSQQYIIAFTDANWYVFDTDGAAVTNGSHAWSDDVFEADFVQSGDVLILVHEDHAPSELRRTGASTFVWSTVALLNVPQFNFDDASSPSPTSCVQSISFTSLADSSRYRLVLNDFITAELSKAGDHATNRERMQQALLDLPIIDSDASTVTITGTNPYTVTFSGNSADDYGEINGIIVAAVSASASVTASVTTPGVSKREDVWSATRGWPKTVLFHENRLVFGGSKSKPATMWMSFANDFFNFKEGVGRADEAIIVTLDTDQLNEIVGLSTNRNLQIFTTGQEFFVPTSPVTPDTIVIKPQSSYGAKKVKPQVLDGFSCYIQRTGASLRRFVLSEFESSYDSVSVSLLAPALIKDPSDMTVQKGVFNIDASYLYAVNSDGSLAVYLSKKEEGLNSFSVWTTHGSFKHVVAVGDDLFVTAEREINGATVYFLEKLYSTSDSQMWCDAGVRYDQAASPTVSGLGHLNGESVRVVADLAVQADATPSSGSITLDRDTEYGWIGLNYNPLIKTMPANVPLQSGASMPLRKRWVRVRPLVLESLGLFISDGVTSVQIADRLFDITPLDTPPDPRSGIDQGVKFLGWTYEAQLEVSQNDPLPFTLSSLSSELS